MARPSTEAGKRLLRAMHGEGLFEDELLAEVEREAALNQHLDESEGRCMCGAREHRGECHFGWHRDGCPDAPKVNMDDYMAGHRQGASDERATTATSLGRFLRRVGGLTVRFEGGKEYVRVPSEWIDDLGALWTDLGGER